MMMIIFSFFLSIPDKGTACCGEVVLGFGLKGWYVANPGLMELQQRQAVYLTGLRVLIVWLCVFTFPFQLAD